ncbi:SymE family type I addiction module toxin [Olivibacter jilunii]|uniref:SymE family type I addiction module toxin n=1 Tax=Olivibacter jilunii TaxID=985016 RepID=UPI003F13FEA5
MRTPEKKKVSKQPEVRSLKIQPVIKFNRCSQTTVPFIRLSGNWLEKLGFSPDRRVNVTTMNKLLIISLDED